MFEIPGASICIRRSSGAEVASRPPPMGTSCHQESSDAPSSRWRPSLGPLTALGGHDFASFAYPSRSERIFSFLYFSLWGPCFPFFSILYEMVFRDIFCPFLFFFFFFRCSDFYIRWRYTNVGDTGA